MPSRTKERAGAEAPVSSNGITIYPAPVALGTKGERPKQTGGFGVRAEVTPLPDEVVKAYNDLAEGEYVKMASVDGDDAKAQRIKASSLIRGWKRSATLHDGFGGFVCITRRDEGKTAVFIGKDVARVTAQLEKLAKKAAS
jgi:hypothetical protein